MESIKVLIAEEDELLQKLYKELIKKVRGVIFLDTVSDIRELHEKLESSKVDLLLFNIELSGFSSFDSLDNLIKNYPEIDYIFILPEKNHECESELLRRNIFKYFITPFSFELLSEALVDYRHYREVFSKKKSEGFSEEIIANGRGYWSLNKREVKSGLNAARLDDIEEFLRKHPDTYSSREVGANLGFSPATARRHLEFLVKVGRIEVKYAYKRVGRPEKRYSALLI